VVYWSDFLATHPEFPGSIRSPTRFSGLVWSGLVWSGLVRSGLVWSGLVWSGLERGPLSLVRITEELLERERNSFGLEH
jgi:hypothetical protein